MRYHSLGGFCALAADFGYFVAVVVVSGLTVVLAWVLGDLHAIVLGC